MANAAANWEPYLVTGVPVAAGGTQLETPLPVRWEERKEKYHTDR
jgi:hypothetical protein